MERFEITLEGLRELSQRIHRKELEPEDWPFLQALVLKQIARGENRQERMLEKIEAKNAAAGEDGTGHVLDAEYSVHDNKPTEGSSSTNANATGPGGSGSSDGGEGLPGAMSTDSAAGGGAGSPSGDEG